MTTADRDPMERLHPLRAVAPQPTGWIPGPAAADGSDDSGDDGVDDGAADGDHGRADRWDHDRFDDWDDPRWSAEDLLTFGVPDDGAVVPGDVAGEDVVDADALEEAEAEDQAIRPTGGAAGRASTAAAGSAAAGAFRARRVRAGGWGRLAEAWVPEPLRDARVDPGRRGALLLTLIAALAAVAAAIGVWRDRPEPRPVQPVAVAPLTDTISVDPARGKPGAGRPDTRASTGPAPTGNPSAGSSASAGPAIIAVSVTGLIRTPGLVRLPAGSRVADAIAAGGGVTGEGSITGLNLAAQLSDGDSVVVGAAPRTPASGSAPGRSVGATTGGTAGGQGPPRTPLNLNTADAATLETLPGVGPVMAANIVAWREQNGSFGSVQQLQEVTGIGPARYAQLAPLVVVR